MPRTVTAENLEAFRDFFTSRVDRGAPDECWPWTGALEATGYGVIGRRTKGGPTRLVRAHRLALQFAGVEITPKQYALHSCDNPKCCNPAHIRLGTLSDNAKDREARKRRQHNYGERNPSSRLSLEQVVEIRRRAADGESQEKLGRAFGVAQTTIGACVRGQTWAWLGKERTQPLVWSRITTAPTNVAVLVYVPNAEHYGEGIYRAIQVDMGTGRRWMTTGIHIGRDCGSDSQPTHWMPLPERPKE